MTTNKKSNTSCVDKDGGVHEIQSYIQSITNTEYSPILIQSLSVDLDFNVQWMVELDQMYKKQANQPSLIGSTHLISGPALSGKLGYVYWRKQQSLDVRLIIIDCAYHSTPYSFCIQLVEQLAAQLQMTLGKTKKTKDNLIQDTEQLTRKIAIEDQVKLPALDKHIKSRPNLKFLFAVKNADVLVEPKKQTILYNFLEWLKTDISSQIGLVLITRSMNFLNKLQKRVRSRFNPKILPIFGPKNVQIIKEALVKRFQFSLKTIQSQGTKKIIRKFIQTFKKSAEVDKLIKQQITRCPKQMVYFLQFFKFIFANKFNSNSKIQKCLKDHKQFKQFDYLMREGAEVAKKHLNPYAKRQIVLFQQMNHPQFIVMAVIRKMIMDNKPKISFKQIKRYLIGVKQTQYSKSGSSFQFPDRVLERALQQLRQIKIVEISKNNDFENAEIYSNLLPQQIKQAIQGVQFLSQYLSFLID